MIEATGDLFDGLAAQSGTEPLIEGAAVLRGFACARAHLALQAVSAITAAAPFRQMLTPGGQRMSVAMSNCGRVGWVSDRQGYRYDAVDPMTGRRWPEMPAELARLATEAAAAAGFGGFEPDACLINRYAHRTKLSLHQDRNERDLSAPVVSVSLGLPAIFLFGGLQRNVRPQRIRLASGDVVVWGGPARRVYHGVEPIAEGVHPLTGCCRINLTFRRAL